MSPIDVTRTAVRPRGIAQTVFVLLSVCAFYVGTGCTESDLEAVPVFPVTGKVLVRGEPAENAQVTLHPVDPAGIEGLQTRPMALAGPDGSFAITTWVTGDGAPAGEYVVTVEWRERADGPFDSGRPDKLRGRYANPAKTTLKVKVTSQPNELSPFELQ